MIDIDPVAFTIPIVNLQIRWYAIIMVSGIILGTWITTRQVRRAGEDPNHVWDGLTWAIPAGIIGARLWYVVNDIMGGGTRYLQDPISIIRIPEGGLHFYGAILFGAAAAVLYAISALWLRQPVLFWLSAGLCTVPWAVALHRSPLSTIDYGLALWPGIVVSLLMARWMDSRLGVYEGFPWGEPAQWVEATTQRQLDTGPGQEGVERNLV